MAITTKAELKAAALDYTARSELDYDLLVTLAENFINPKLLPVRERETDGAAFSLATDADTNWLLTNAPHIYFAAVLVEVFAFSRATTSVDDATMWQQRLAAAIDDLLWENARDTSARLSVDSDLFRLSQLGWRNVTNLSDSISGSGSSSSDLLD